MSSSPRSRSSQTAIFALAVGAADHRAEPHPALPSASNVLEAGQEFVTGLYPPIAVTSEGAQIRDLYTVIFLIAVAIFLVVEGPDHLDGHPLSAQADRRRPAAPDPRQQHRRVRLDDRPDHPRPLHVRHLVADAQRGRHELADGADQDPRGRRPVPVEVRVPRRHGRHKRRLHGVHARSTRRTGGGMYVPAGRTVQLQLFVSPKDVIHAFYVPQFLFKRDVVPGRTHRFDFTVNDVRRRPDLPRPVRRAVRRRPQQMLFDVKAVTADRVRRLAGGQGRQGERHARPAAERRRRDAPSRSARSASSTSRPRSARRPAPRSGSTSRTRTRRSRTTSRSTRARRPARRSSRARSSRAWRPRPMTSRRSPPAPMPSSVPCIRR